MNARKWLVVGLLCCTMLVSLGGCPLVQTRTSNQGGGNLITAGLKIANDNLGGLTPDEIQVLTDLAISQASLPIPALTDAQAAAITQFMDDNNLNTIADVQDLRNRSLDEIVISEEVLAELTSDEVIQIIANLTGINLEGILP
jgi:hypothetical protein